MIRSFLHSFVHQFIHLFNHPFIYSSPPPPPSFSLYIMNALQSGEMAPDVAFQRWTQKRRRATGEEDDASSSCFHSSSEEEVLQIAKRTAPVNDVASNGDEGKTINSETLVRRRELRKEFI